MTNIQAKMELLFEFEKELNQLLDTEEYELFHQQQSLFGEQIKNVLNQHSEDELQSVVGYLKRLQSMVASLQQRADIYTKLLKEKSLQLQRNKKKIKAYK